jgi:hypothetical protein
MPTQGHGSALWRERAGSGAAPATVPVYFILDGAGPDIIPSTLGPEQFAFFLVGADYVLINLTPVGGVYHDTAGNAQAIDPAVTPRLRAVQVRGGIQLY